MSRYLANVSERRYEEDYFPARTARAAAQWLERNYKRPFFLYVDMFDPHEPWDPPEHYVAKYVKDYTGEAVTYPRYDVAGYLSDEELRYCRALYAGEVSLVDHWVGYLLQRIEDLGLYDDTLVIFMADHGFCLGEHGYIGKSLISPDAQQALPLYPEVARIPFLTRVPGAVRRGRVKGYVQPVDVMPTILDFLGVAIPDCVQGHSLMPLINGEKEQVRPFCVSSPTISGPRVKVPHPCNRMTVTYGEWSFVFGSQAEGVEESEYTQMVDSIWRQIKMLEPPPILPELYHLPTDPTCTRNVITEHFDVARSIHRELIRHLEKIGVEDRHLPYFSSFPSMEKWKEKGKSA